MSTPYCTHHPLCATVGDHREKIGQPRSIDDYDPICDCGEPAYACDCPPPSGPGGPWSPASWAHARSCGTEPRVTMVMMPFRALKHRSRTTSMTMKLPCQIQSMFLDDRDAKGLLIKQIRYKKEDQLLSNLPGAAFFEEPLQSKCLKDFDIEVTIRRIPPEMRMVLHVDRRRRRSRTHLVPSHTLSRKKNVFIGFTVMVLRSNVRPQLYPTAGGFS